MIHYLKRNQIDTSKYNACIQNSHNSRIYAFSWYLDAVADNWDVLILDDYKVVMPLPWKTKFFIKFVYKPSWTQQLGVFSPESISKELVSEFINTIPKKFKKIAMQFNSGNLVVNDATEKVNYILDLSPSYDALFKKYKSDRRNQLRRIAKEDTLSIKEIEIKELIRLFVENYQDKEVVPIEEYNKLEKLTAILKAKKQVEVLGVFDENSRLISGAMFFRDSKRLTYLFSASTPKGKKEQCSLLLLDSIVKENSESNLHLDFEGSIIPGIAFFYKSFGAQKEIYQLYQKKYL